MSTEIYTNLQFEDATAEIRLVKLQPCNDPDGAVELHLERAALSTNPQYEALSYVWGTSRSGKHVQVNGTRFGVTDNLDLALRRIRHNTIERTIWIDAICINQTDLSERGSQVSIMGRIFGQAEMVICWLGVGNGSEHALHSLDLTDVLSSGKLGVHEGHSIDDDFVESLTDEICTVLLDIAAKPYWKRVWIIQEIVLAKAITIVYGDIELPWEFMDGVELVAANKLARDRFAILNSKFETISDLTMSAGLVIRYRSAAMLKEEVNTLELLDQVRMSAATDDRDRIFALYGLIALTDHFTPVDYTKETEEIYLSFARTHILRTQSLSLLLYAPGPRMRGLELPSWVPDWTITAKTISFPHTIYDAPKGQAHVPQTHHMHTLDSVLTVRGIVCDRISMFKSVHDDQGSKVQRWGLEEILFSKGPYEYPSGIPRLQALFRCSIADRYMFSRDRLNSTPDLWLQRLIIGYCIDLGSQAKPESYLPAMIGASGPGAFGTDDLLRVSSVSKTYIEAYKAWTEVCSHLLTDAISNGREATAGLEGPFVTPSLSNRVRLCDEGNSVLHRLQCSRPSSEWLEALRKARVCTSDQEIMELILGHIGEPATIEWPQVDGLPSSHQKFYWDRYHISTGSLTTPEGVYFGTSRGYIGISGSAVQAGDLVCVLCGCPTPVILRSVGSQFSLIADCFVEGLMDGQAVDMVDAGELEYQVMQLV